MAGAVSKAAQQPTHHDRSAVQMQSDSRCLHSKTRRSCPSSMWSLTRGRMEPVSSGRAEMCEVTGAGAMSQPWFPPNLAVWSFTKMKEKWRKQPSASSNCLPPPRPPPSSLNPYRQNPFLYHKTSGHILKRVSLSKCNSPLTVETCSSSTASVIIIFFGTLFFVKQCRCLIKTQERVTDVSRVPFFSFLYVSELKTQPITWELIKQWQSVNAVELPFNAES